MAAIIVGVSGSTLTGGSGNDALVGDLRIAGGSVRTTLEASAGNAAGSVDGADGVNVAFDLNDSIAGSVRLDLLVGNGGTERDVAAGRGGDNATVHAFNDTLTGGSGNDVLTGDLIGSSQVSTNFSTIVVDVGRGGEFTSVYGSEPSIDTVTATGGSNARVTAFSDSIDGGSDRDVLIGDVASTAAGSVNIDVTVGAGGRAYFYESFPPQWQQLDSLDVSGGSGNHVTLFNDTVRASGSSYGETIIGDIQTGAGGAYVRAQVGGGGRVDVGYHYGGDEVTNAHAAGGDNNVLAICDDSLEGTAGNDTIVGDVAVSDGGYVTLVAVAWGGGATKPAPGGNSNSVDAFCDAVSGADGNDLLIGDVRAQASGSIALAAASGASGGSGDGGTGNRVVAFDDTLNGAAGNDTLVGEARLENVTDRWASVDMRAAAGSLPPDGGAQFGTGGAHNVVVAMNDLLKGGDGNDWIAGELYASGSTSVPIVIAGAAGDGTAGANAGGDDNALDTANDQIFGGAGGDRLIGDVVMFVATSDLQLVASAGNGGDGTRRHGYSYFDGRAGGADNTTTFGCDHLSGGAEADEVVGDVLSTSGGGGITLTARVGCGYDATRYHIGGGDGGNGNAVTAFADAIAGDRGDDQLIGDVSAASDVTLRAGAGRGGTLATFSYDTRGGEGGDNNHVHAFGDSISGADGRDVIVGDVYESAFPFAASSDIMLDASAGRGGDGGSDNVVAAFADLLQGGVGDDDITGDVRTESILGSIRFTVEAGLTGMGNAGGEGGLGNSVVACNDTLEGGTGNDTLVGDVRLEYAPASVEMVISGTADDTISAFADRLIGGDGNDVLAGDDFAGSAGVAPDLLAIAGDFAGRDQLFADTLRGGDGDDTLIGGLGADDMRGGDGDDTFVWSVDDLTAVAADGSPPVDRITGFEAGDTLDFRPLLASFGFTAESDANDWLSLRTQGAATVLSIDQNGSAGGAAFDDVVVLAGFTTPQTLDQLIDQDVILIA